MYLYLLMGGGAIIFILTVLARVRRSSKSYEEHRSSFFERIRADTEAAKEDALHISLSEQLAVARAALLETVRAVCPDNVWECRQKDNLIIVRSSVWKIRLTCEGSVQRILRHSGKVLQGQGVWHVNAANTALHTFSRTENDLNEILKYVQAQLSTGKH